MISRTSSIPVCEAASISITSTCRDSMIGWQCTPSSGIWIVGRATAGRAPRARQFIIEGTGEDARGRGLADAAYPGQNIGLVDAFEGEGVRQSLDHGVLADQILEARGAVFAGKDAIGSRLCADLVLRRDRAQSQPGTGFVMGVRG